MYLTVFKISFVYDLYDERNHCIFINELLPSHIRGVIDKFENFLNYVNTVRGTNK